MNFLWRNTPLRFVNRKRLTLEEPSLKSLSPFSALLVSSNVVIYNLLQQIRTVNHSTLAILRPRLPSSDFITMSYLIISGQLLFSVSIIKIDYYNSDLGD